MATNKEKKNEAKVLTGNFQITVKNDEGKELKCVLTPPNRFVVQAAMSKMLKASGDVDMIGAGEIVFNSCVIEEGDLGKDVAEMKKSDILLCSVYMKCFEIVEIKEATLAKI